MPGPPHLLKPALPSSKPQVKRAAKEGLKGPTGLAMENIRDVGDNNDRPIALNRLCRTVDARCDLIFICVVLKRAIYNCGACCIASPPGVLLLRLSLGDLTYFRRPSELSGCSVYMHSYVDGVAADLIPSSSSARRIFLVD